MKKTLSSLLAFGMLAISTVASAVPIDGGVAFGTAPGGTWTPTGGANALDVAGATGVAFSNTLTPGADEGVVTSATGTFAGSDGTTTDFMNFVFNPLTAGTQLWQFTYNGTTFQLFMDTSNILVQTNTQIGLHGLGTLTATGFDNTVGSWDLTLNKNGNGANAVFSFSSGAATVPEPGVMLLLGAALIGVGATRKFRKSA